MQKCQTIELSDYRAVGLSIRTRQNTPKKRTITKICTQDLVHLLKGVYDTVKMTQSEVMYSTSFQPSIFKLKTKGPF